MKRKTTQKLIKVSEAAEILNVHANTLRKWDKKGILKAIRFGIRKDRRYRKAEITKLTQKTKKILLNEKGFS